MSARPRQRSLFATAGAGDGQEGDELVMPDRGERDVLFKRMDFNGNGESTRRAASDFEICV